jgi:DegV family protein with EDD domain
MASIKIVTDSSADISPQLANELGIEVVPLLSHIGDQTYRAGLDIGNDQFYSMLQEGALSVRTSAPASVVFEQLYRKLALEYDYIFSIHLSSRLGGVYRAAVQARAKLPASLTRIEVIDSKLASMGLGWVAIAAARAARDGMPPEQVALLINSLIQHTHIVFFVDNIEYLEHGGRLSVPSAVLGSMQRTKPLLILDEGDIVPYERTRTRAKAIEGLYTFIEDFPNVQEVIAMYATTAEDIEKLLEKVDLVFSREKVQIAQFGPIIGAHLGPGAMGVVVFEGMDD